uniref:Uncharacterized protein n=1 Tax=Seriola lalandi dorsalis TaxID=1841481 RepID=A0A3B4WX71_SERLL
MPGTLPTRRTTILSLLFPVRTFTALLMVMLSRLMPFTSTSLSPTSRPASSVKQEKSDTQRLNKSDTHVTEVLLSGPILYHLSFFPYCSNSAYLLCCCPPPY